MKARVRSVVNGTKKMISKAAPDASPNSRPSPLADWAPSCLGHDHFKLPRNIEEELLSFRC
jgi:hypothetical protein